jgi:type 1 fimbria pilin
MKRKFYGTALLMFLILFITRATYAENSEPPYFFPIGKNEGTVVFEALILPGGTCTMAVPNKLDLGDFSPKEALTKPWVVLQPKAFKLTVSQCAEMLSQDGEETGAPKIKIKGIPLPDGDPSLFSNGENNTGFGVAIYKKKENINTSPPAIEDKALLYKPNDTFSVSVPKTQQNTWNHNASTAIELWAAVACGDNCKLNKMKGGKVEATITFEFLYG